MHPQTTISRKSQITKITISKGFATLETDNFFGTPWFETGQRGRSEILF